jgi:RNA polymerase sigma-70 factor (ECF subfamily)
VPEIARAFLTTAPTVHQRIVRAKRKIEAAGIPYSVSTGDELTRRTDGVLRLVYLVFNEGHTATTSETAIRADLCAEAVRLARLLVELLPDIAECRGLLALLLLTDARRPGRMAADGRLVALADQNRTRWDSSRRRDRLGPHRHPLPGARAARSEPGRAHQPDGRDRQRRRPACGMRLLDTLDAGELDGYVPFRAARADLARRLGDDATAAPEHERAIATSANEAEPGALHECLEALACDRPSGT